MMTELPVQIEGQLFRRFAGNSLPLLIRRLAQWPLSRSHDLEGRRLETGMLMVYFPNHHPMNDITLMLQAASRGERQAAEDLFPLVYAELRRMAAARMVDEAAGQTLQPTALVHEAWLQMVGTGDRIWQNRGHFFGTAAAAMRHILIDQARRKAALKHGGGQSRVPLENLDITAATPDEHLLLVEEALQWLEREDPEKARIVCLKFFGGLTNEEVAECLGLGLRTVVRQWVYAKVKLFRWIQSQS